MRLVGVGTGCFPSGRHRRARPRRCSVGKDSRTVAGVLPLVKNGASMNKERTSCRPGRKDGAGVTANQRITTVAMAAVAVIGIVAISIPPDAQAAVSTAESKPAAVPPTPVNASHDPAKTTHAPKKKARAARGVLIVRAKFLGSAKKPKVRVVGRSAPKHPVKLGKRLRLRAGTYTLISYPVKTATGTRYTASKRMKVRVRPKKTARATLRYRVLVPKRTRVVSNAAARKIEVVTDRSLRMPAAQAQTLKRGSIITAGVTPATPDGLLRKVISKRVSGRTATLVTAPATLREALPEGEFSVRIGEDGTVTGSGLTEAENRQHASASVDLSRSFKLDQAWGAGERASGCSFHGTGLRANAQVTPRASASVTASWPLFGSPELSVDSSLQVSGSASIEGEVTGSCKITKRSPVARLAAITVFAGPVPVVLTPALSGVAELSIGSSMKANVGASVNARVSGGFTYKNGLRFRGSNTRELNPTTISFAESAGSAKLTLSPEFSLLVYGTAGPKLSFSGGITGTVQPSSNPWWWLDGHVGGKVGAKFTVLGIDLNADHTIFERTWRIASASPKAAPTPPFGGGTPSQPVPGGGSPAPNPNPPTPPGGGAFPTLPMVGHSLGGTWLRDTRWDGTWHPGTAAKDSEAGLIQWVPNGNRFLAVCVSKGAPYSMPGAGGSTTWTNWGAHGVGSSWDWIPLGAFVESVNDTLPGVAACPAGLGD